VKTDRHVPQLASVGLPFLVVEIASREALRRAKPDAAAFARALAQIGRDSVYFYTRDVPASEQAARPAGRPMLHSGREGGMSEDPATGSANPRLPRRCSPISIRRAMANCT